MHLYGCFSFYPVNLFPRTKFDDLKLVGFFNGIWTIDFLFYVPLSLNTKMSYKATDIFVMCFVMNFKLQSLKCLSLNTCSCKNEYRSRLY